MASSSSDRVYDAVARRVPDDLTAVTLREWIVLFGVTLAAVVLLWAAGFIPVTSMWRPLVTALGTGLLVSAVFSFVQRMVTGRGERRAQARYLTEFASVLSEEFRQQVAQVRGDASTHDFPGSPKPDPRFNGVLMADLHGAPYYWFRGYSARFVAARLRLGTATACQVRVILPDPRDPNSLNLRSSYLSRAGRGEQDDGKVRDQLLRDLRLGLVGLFLARHEVASIELLMTRAPGQDRVELFPSAVWVTLYSGEGENAEFPHTLRYPNTSILHQIQTSECVQIRESPHIQKYELNKNTTEEQFRSIYEELTTEPLLDERWSAVKQDYRAFEEEFRRVVRMSGVQSAGIGQDSS